ncbi:hypothetical protein E0494_06195 [Marinilabiliaceae bacterium JC040]|nr:hypothetical protein [Marinilabiliaceae bacterium JC040]
MNKIEKFVYDSLKNNPRIKGYVRNLYQLSMDILPRPKNYSLNEISCKSGYFFGFHDKNPFSTNEDMVLAQSTIEELRMPMQTDSADIGYFDFSNGKLGSFTKLSETFAWNYHKGCRLQWLNDDEIIFNTAVKNNVVSKIVSVKNKKERILKRPIDTVSEDGKYATFFSYERLENDMPGYGYPYSDSLSFLHENISKNTGLYIFNINDENEEMVISLYDLWKLLDDKDKYKNYHHFVTHTEFSSDSRYVSFMHRWTNPSNTDKRWSLLYVYDLLTKAIIKIPVDNMVSHYVWNEHKILAYCRIDGIDSHVIFNIDNLNEFSRILPEKLNSDGHQSFINSCSFITDTYPNARRMQKLYKINLFDNSCVLVASLYHRRKFSSSLKKGNICVDLHPIVSKSGDFVCFDSGFNKERSLCVMSLKK